MDVGVEDRYGCLNVGQSVNRSLVFLLVAEQPFTASGTQRRFFGKSPGTPRQKASA